MNNDNLVPVVMDRLPHDHDKLKAIAQERLEKLNSRQREFAIEYARSGAPAASARFAGYADGSDTARKLRRNPKIMAAVHALAALRSSEGTLNVTEATSLLESMIEVNAESFLVRNQNGDVIGIKDMNLLSMAERSRLKKIQAKIRRSARGERSHIVNLSVELTPLLEVFDRLAKLNGWYGNDEPAFAVNVLATGETTIDTNQFDPLLGEICDLVLDDAELLEFFNGTDDEKRQLLRTGLERLKSQKAVA
jgi:hypothetical protein